MENISESAIRHHIKKMLGKPYGRKRITYPFVKVKKVERRNVKIYELNIPGMFQFMAKNLLSSLSDDFCFESDQFIDVFN